MITSGAQQAIHLIIRGLLKPGDAAAIEDPSYAYSLPIFHSEGLNTHLLPVQNGGIDPDQIVELHKKTPPQNVVPESHLPKSYRSDT
ncbi:hypothetical protein APP_34500 [Aeribacillus pallidus]|uniref:aminotransferase class I/II-fold pyridoxal phosphate-dependent enzyme n=1 Tax=Aeribacillus pallidus TaxID=33936 RepID=UPI0013991D72|nr:hypothetical protein APP_34500 [Aeribacillus pallidus]